MKLPEVGNLQQITEHLVDVYLLESKTVAGAVEVPANRVYADFMTYLASNEYSIRPSLRAFGRVLCKRLPFRKSARGTQYLVSWTLGHCPRASGGASPQK